MDDEQQDKEGFLSFALPGSCSGAKEDTRQLLNVDGSGKQNRFACLTRLHVYL